MKPTNRAQCNCKACDRYLWDRRTLRVLCCDKPMHTLPLLHEAVMDALLPLWALMKIEHCDRVRWKQDLRLRWRSFAYHDCNRRSLLY